MARVGHGFAHAWLVAAGEAAFKTNASHREKKAAGRLAETGA